MVESQNFGQNKQFQPKETAVFVDLVKYGKLYISIFINTTRMAVLWQAQSFSYISTSM